ncbi:glycosyltransferase [Candidatus Woesearchaeota archaeon]|nr:glycosyltransferase [Candidatus Woesearchaeota archaeon]
MRQKQKKQLHIVVMIPTYNERENIQELLPALLKLPANIHFLVVDDHSPDRTWQVVERMQKKNPRIHLLDRKRERGRGTAGIAGYRWALQDHADLILEMDADFSHPPILIPKLIAGLQKNDVVLASRLIDHGLDEDRIIFRKWLTLSSIFYVRLLLGIPVQDVNSGFRGFRRAALEDILPYLKSKRTDIVQEVLYLCYLHGYKIQEIPLAFQERKWGRTKKTLADFWEAFATIIKLKIRHWKGEI